MNILEDIENMRESIDLYKPKKVPKWKIYFNPKEQLAFERG